MFRVIAAASLTALSVIACATDPPADSKSKSQTWVATETLAAPEANQAAAADENFVYAITNTLVAKYDRLTGKRVAVSTGDAKHLNSGFLKQGKLYCAHSNYPQTPEHSELKVLNLETMQLTTFKDFGNFGGSLTWAVLRGDHWWCNFARYGTDNGKSRAAGRTQRQSSANSVNTVCQAVSGMLETYSSRDTMTRSCFACGSLTQGRSCS